MNSKVFTAPYSGTFAKLRAPMNLWPPYHAVAITLVSNY